MNMTAIRTLLREVEAKHTAHTLTQDEYARAEAHLSSLVPKQSTRSGALFEALLVFKPR